jgi:hypothetical protein
MEPDHPIAPYSPPLRRWAAKNAGSWQTDSEMMRQQGGSGLAANGAPGRQTKPRSRRLADPIERQIELALRPGEFIGERAVFSFVSSLDGVASEVRALTRSDPVRATALCEAFLAGCHEKVEELDDSSGSFGQFVRDLICLWIKARQGSGADADMTASTLLAWMDDDPYAFCCQIEKDAVAAFNKAGLAAFEKQVRKRFEAVSGEPSGYPGRRWSEVLRAIYYGQRNIPAYVALAEQSGLKAKDCLAVAKLLAGQKPNQALAWVQRGRALDRESQFRYSAAYDLDRIHRQLLTKVGRKKEALEAAWADFREHPSKFTYDELMKFVPKVERQEWQEKALTAAKGEDLYSLLELFVETRAMERLADLVSGSTDEALEHVSHYATEPAAKKLEKGRPDLAARLWRAQGMRIVDAKKSKYYDAALSNFERARDCYQRAGLAAQWEETVGRVRAAHHRKAGFISEFEFLVAGARRAEKPSFLQRAKARWSERQGGGNS